MKPRNLPPSSPTGIILVIVLWNALSAAALAQAVPWVKLGHGPVYEVVNGLDGGKNSNEVTVPIPLLLLPGIKPEEVTVKLLDVRLGNRYMQGLAEAFTVGEKVAAANGRGPFMSVKVDFSKAATQGNYSLLIGAATPSQPSPQILELQIARPPAKLKGQTTLIVDRVLSPFSEPEVSGLSMTLVEEGGLTGVTAINAKARDFLGDRGQVIGGTIKCPSPPILIAPGGSEELKYELSGDFPLGTSRGTLEIRSPQMSEALPVAFEVRTRYAPWLILIIIILGLLTGYLLRTLLQQRIKLGETRLQSLALRERMRSEAARRPDETFRNRIGAAIVKLNSALSAGKADLLSQAIVDSNEELRAALKEFEDRRNRAQEELDSFEQLVKTRWDLPDSTCGAVAAAGIKVEGLRARLLGDEVKLVEMALADARSELDAGLRRTLGEWRRQQKAVLESLDVRLVPDSVAAAVSKEVAEAQSLLDRAADLKRDSTLDVMTASLEATHKARAWLSELFVKLRRWLEYEVTETLRVLRRTKVPDTASLVNLERVVAGFTVELAAATEPEDAAMLLTPERLSELDTALRDAVERQMDGANFTDQERGLVTPLLDGRKYVEAARVAYVPLEKRLRNAVSGARREESVPVEAAAAAAPPADPARAATGAPPPALLPPRVLRAEQMPAPVDLSPSRTYWELLWAKSLQFVLIGLGIAAVGYLLFEGRFVGTFADMAGIFLWGFGLDVSLDTFLRVSKGTEPRAAG